MFYCASLDIKQDINCGWQGDKNKIAVVIM